MSPARALPMGVLLLGVACAPGGRFSADAGRAREDASALAAWCGDGLCDRTQLEHVDTCPFDCPTIADCSTAQLGLPYGTMQAQRGAASQIMLVAPHGTYDLNTADMVESLRLQLDCNAVIADGYRTRDHFINVNRPTETRDETLTPRASEVYQVFRTCVEQFSPHLYVELHGNARAETASTIEVATVHVDLGLAQRLQQSFTQLAEGTLDSFTMRIEPLDSLYWRASGNKQWGMMSHCDESACLHLELPRALREPPLRSQVVRILKAWLSAVL